MYNFKLEECIYSYCMLAELECEFFRAADLGNGHCLPLFYLWDSITL